LAGDIYLPSKLAQALSPPADPDLYGQEVLRSEHPGAKMANEKFEAYKQLLRDSDEMMASSEKARLGGDLRAAQVLSAKAILKQETASEMFNPRAKKPACRSLASFASAATTGDGVTSDRRPSVCLLCASALSRWSILLPRLGNALGPPDRARVDLASLGWDFHPHRIVEDWTVHTVGA
jgi:hypothetical protein